MQVGVLTLASAPVDQSLDKIAFFRCLFLKRRYRMAICVEGDRDGRVAQSLLDDLYVFVVEMGES